MAEEDVSQDIKRRGWPAISELLDLAPRSAARRACCGWPAISELLDLSGLLAPKPGGCGWPAISELLDRM